MSQSDTLPIPDVAKRDPQSLELVRVWIAEKGQHVSLRTGAWQDPAAWGIMLADLAKHITNSYREDAGLDPVATLQRIKSALYAELTSPTDQPSGQIQG